MENNNNNEILNGEITKYHDNGMKSVYNYVNGVKHGPHVMYYENGWICCEGNYVNGKGNYKNYGYFNSG